MQELRLLGPVNVVQLEDDTRTGKANVAARFRSRRTVALLGYLAVERRPLAREQLAAFFWPDDPPARGRSNLRRELYNLAHILPDCWQTNAQTVLFAPSWATSVDIDTLKGLIAVERWLEAAEWAAGDFLEGLSLDDNAEFENWLLSERERWRECLQTVLRAAAAEERRHGRYAAALPYARRLLRCAPWEEASHRDLMRLLAWSGQREEALRQFAICRAALADELDIEPSVETVALYERLRAGALAPPAPPPPFLLAESPATGAARPSFVHRERELAWLGEHLRRAVAGQGGVVFLTGGSGRGKTALLDAFADAALAAHSQLLIAWGNCSYGGSGEAYLPFRELLTMLCAAVETRWSAGTISTAIARRLWAALPLVTAALLDHGPRLLDIFVPGADLLRRATAAGADEAPWLQRLHACAAGPTADGPPIEQGNLFEQASNFLGAVAHQRPLLLLLDDLQWIDSASIGLLFHLARCIRQRGDPILIVCAYRPDEIMPARGAQPGLADMLGELRRQLGDVWLSLGWSGEPDGRCFVDALLDCEPNRFSEDFRAALFRRTDGHPLFTVELLRTMRERGDLRQDSGGTWTAEPQLDWQRIPARVEAVIEARIRHLPLELQQLLTVASLEGETFTAEVAAQVQGLDQRMVLHLLAHDLDQRHRLVREQESFLVGGQPVTRCRFRHAMFREYLVRQLGRGERQLLHGAVAAAMEVVYAADLEQVGVQLAHHYWQAGDNGRAQHYFTRAAQSAARIYAFDQAIAHFTRAIDLAGRNNTGEQALAELYQGRGLAYSATGRFEPAYADLQTVLELGRAAPEPLRQWQVLTELGRLWSSRDYGKARAMYQQALELARGLDDPPLLAHTLNCLGNWHANDEHPIEALECHAEALRIFEELGDQPNIAVTLDFLNIAHLLHADYAAGAAYSARAIARFRSLGDDPRLVSSLIPRALISSGSLLLAVPPVDSPGDPFAFLDEAEQIARRIGSAADEAWAAWAAALLHTAYGQLGAAQATSQQSLQLAAALGHREWLVGSLNASGIVHNALLQPQRALPDLQQGLALARELRSQYWVNHVTGAMAECYLLLGDSGGAQRCLEVILSRSPPMDTAGTRLCWARRAELALAVGDAELTLEICERLIASAAGAAPGAVLPYLWLLRGRALAEKGEVEEALVLLENGRSAASTDNQRFLLWRFPVALAQLHVNAGRRNLAEQELLAAWSLITEMAATLPDETDRIAFQDRAAAALAFPGLVLPISQTTIAARGGSGAVSFDNS